MMTDRPKLNPMSTAPRDGTLVMLQRNSDNWLVPRRWKHGAWVFTRGAIGNPDAEYKGWMPIPEDPEPEKEEWKALDCAKVVDGDAVGWGYGVFSNGQRLFWGWDKNSIERAARVPDIERALDAVIAYLNEFTLDDREKALLNQCRKARGGEDA